jgi:Zn-dependent protease with chaperone function
MNFNKLWLNALFLSLGLGLNSATNAETPAYIPNPPGSSTSPEAELRGIRDRASEDALLRYWLEALMNGAIKHGLDRAVDVNLRGHEVAQEFYRGVMKDVDEVIYQYRIQQLKTSALAKAGEKGQYQDLLKMVQEVADALGFPPEARANIHVYVSGQPVVNAYTYSGTTKVIEVVVYQGLLDLMQKDPGALRQVIGHELGHIKSGHIRNRLLLLAVFNATAEDLIPDPAAVPEKAADPKAAEKKALVEQAIYEQAKVLIGGEAISQSNLRGLLSKASSALLLHASADTQERMAQEVVSRVLAISNDIRARTTAAQRLELSTSLIDTVMNYGTQTNPKEGAAAKKERREPDFKELKDFMAKLDGVLSRAQEISSDRYGLLATKNERDSIMAYVRMAGGSGATIEGMLAQQEELDELMLNNPESLLEDGSHPIPGERAEQFAEFLKHPGFLIYSQSYLQAIYEYLSLSQLIHQGDVVIGKDMADLSVVHHARWKREKAIAFAQELSNWVEKQVTKEIDDAVVAENPTGAKFVQLKGLLDMLESFTTGGRGALEGRLFQDWIKDLSRPNRLVSNLVAYIATLLPRYRDNAPAKLVLEKASEALKAAAPGFEGGAKKVSQNFADELAKKPGGGLPPAGCDDPLKKK